MASKPYVPLSTTQGSTSLSSSFPVRAPITAEDDSSDYESQTEHAYSDSDASTSIAFGSEFEEYASGEEFESASEKLFADEENREVFRPFVKYELSRPFVADTDGGSLGNSVMDEEESGVADEFDPVVESGGPNLQPGIMPIAQVSVDEDDFDELIYDEGMVSGGEEDGRFAGIGVIARVDSAPRVRVSDVEEDKEDELLLQKVGNGVELDLSSVESSVVGLEGYGEALVEKKEGILKENVELNEDVKHVFDDSVSVESVEDDVLVEKKEAILKEKAEVNEDVKHVFYDSVSVGLVNNDDDFVEKKEAILKENAELNEDVKHVFDDSVSVELVKDDDLAEKKEDVLKKSSNLDDDDDDCKSSIEERLLYGHVGQETTKLNVGDEPNAKNMEIDFMNHVSEQCSDCGRKEQIGEAVNVFIDTHENELNQVHTILAELQELEVDDGSNNIDEAVIDPVDGSVQRIVSEPEEAEEATSLEINEIIDGSVHDSEKLEDKTSESIAPGDDAISVDSMENVDLIQVSKADGLERSTNSLDVGEVSLDSEKTGVQESLISNAELEVSYAPIAVADDNHDHIDGQIVSDSDSDEEMDINKEHKGKHLFDPAAFAALLRAAAGAELDGGKITLTSADGRVFSVEHPGSSFDTVGKASQSDTVKDVVNNNICEEDKKLIEKIQHIRVKFLRLVQRLGLSPEDPVVAQVLYRLVLAAGGHVSDEFSLEAAKRTALQLEAVGEDDDLDFSLNILVIGKTGVGKSATINSIFGEKKVLINAFEPATSTVKEIVGTVNGVRIRVLDSPGLRFPVNEEATNRKTLASIKKIIKRFPPDVVLYVDRLDTYARDLNDLPLLSSVTNSLTASIWRNVIVTLTHAAAVPPDGPYGSPLSFETFVARRSHVVQQLISQAVGDIRMMDSSMMHPVALVENHPSCRKNEDGESILSNGQSWRLQLLLLCYSLKILSEANSINKPRNPFDHRKLFGQLRSLPVPHLLSSLLQSRPHLKLTAEQGGDDVDSDVELLDLSDSDEEDEDEYDQLPPFKPLKKSMVNKLSKEQRKAYFEEYDYRVNLLQKKQLKEEVKRLKELKKKLKDSSENVVNQEEEEGPATVPVAMPEFSLPLSFDSDNPSYRYRALEHTSQVLIRPVLDTQGWDHDFGYDGVNLEKNLVIADQFPGAFSVQITKDKKDFSIHLDSSICAKHGENGSTMAGFDIQNIGRQLAYILRTETQFKNFKLNKTSAGLCLTLSGENVATGLKIEDQITFGKQLALAGSAGAVRSKGDTALGANFEIRLKSKDYPVNQDQSTLGFSVMKWRSDSGVVANLQSQFSIGRNSKMAIRVGMNNKQSGQISIKTSSSELQLAAICIFPILASIVRTLFPDSAARNSNFPD
ncbi:translocase of chloroplast 101, chloroplastic [Euphorbia lathyris]|uniref:translocase of chloroplast 101, chloroplastic n=1 Tax=Euphorbia lathyris TaxID=212925 RepID=UPI003313A720